jgi:potassium-dependent mechanosensitive channel
LNRPLQVLIALCFVLLQVAPVRADDANLVDDNGEALAPTSTSDLALLVGRVAEAQADTERQIEALASIDDRAATLRREDELLAAFEDHLSTEAEDVFFHGRIATIEDRLGALRTRLEILMHGISADLDRLGTHRDRWAALETAWSRQALGERMSRDTQRELASEIRSVRTTIRATQQSLDQANDGLLELQSRVLAVTTRARALSQKVTERRAALRSSWLERTSPPIWAHARDGTGPFWNRLLDIDAGFLGRARDTLIRHAVFIVLAFVAARRLARAPGATAAISLLQRPFSLALFASTLVLGASYQPSPPIVDALRWAIVGVTGARLAWVTFAPLGLPRVGIALATGEPAVRFVEAVGLPTLALRWIVVATALAVAAILLLRRRQILEPKRWWWRAGLGIGEGLLLLAAVAEALGFAALGRSVFGATLDTGFFVFVLVLGHRLARGIAEGVGSMIVPWVTERWQETIEHWARALGWALQVAVFVRVALQVTFAWQLTPPPGATWKTLTGASITALDYQIPLAKVALAALALYVARQIIRVVELGLDSAFLRRPGIDAGTGNSIKTIVRYGLLAIGVVLALAVLGIELQNIAILAGALGIGIGFGLQSVVADFTAGLILLFEQSLRAGDSLIIDGKWGTVSRIGLRSTVITMIDQSELVVPNSMLTSEKLQNWTLSTKQARIFCQVGIAYGSNVELAFEVLERIAAEDPEVLDDPPPEVLFMEFADSSLNLELRVWLDKAVSRLQARSRILRAIDREFRKHGIVIAFPQRDVHVHMADQGSAPALKPSPGRAETRSEADVDA